MLTAVMSALLEAHETLQTQYNVIHRPLLDLVRGDPLCRRLMTARRWAGDRADVPGHSGRTHPLSEIAAGGLAARLGSSLTSLLTALIVLVVSANPLLLGPSLRQSVSRTCVRHGQSVLKGAECARRRSHR